MYFTLQHKRAELSVARIDYMDSLGSIIIMMSFSAWRRPILSCSSTTLFTGTVIYNSFHYSEVQRGVTVRVSSQITFFRDTNFGFTHDCLYKQGPPSKFGPMLPQAHGTLTNPEGQSVPRIIWMKPTTVTVRQCSEYTCRSVQAMHFR